jgi:UDP-N-acetylmuramoyl-L-alanyl-D-glutamate--2,6-diaminopimelate ligase
MSSGSAAGERRNIAASERFDLSVLDRLGVRIANLVTDSRMIKPGDTFVACPGCNFDGRDFIPQAIAAGANAVLWEREGFAWNPSWNIPNLPVANLRSSAGIIADQAYGHPSAKLWLIGITGTNGKTSCSHWIAQAMTALGKETGVVGTLGTGFLDELEQIPNTTPDAILLHRKMAELLSDGAQCVAMEMSSHGLDQERANGATFAVALLTNLSRDHLDYHGDMRHYAAAKARLFHWPGLKWAILNLDEPFGIDLARQLQGPDPRIIGYGFGEPMVQVRDIGKISLLRGRNLRSAPWGLEFSVEFEDEHVTFKTELTGSFNASNLLGVLAVLLASGFGLAQAVRALQDVVPVAGRMQQMGGGEQPLVVVDYAHTPDALEKVLLALREILHGSAEAGTGASVNTGKERSDAKLICVFGCGGERDQGKRPLLGAVATRLADKVIITNDNPRREDARVIIDEILAGAGANHHVEQDRARAISQAVRSAKKGDVVLIAGKGHESYQEIDGKKYPFSDAEVVQRILTDLKSGSPPGI